MKRTECASQAWVLVSPDKAALLVSRCVCWLGLADQAGQGQTRRTLAYAGVTLECEPCLGRLSQLPEASQGKAKPGGKKVFNIRHLCLGLPA